MAASLGLLLAAAAQLAALAAAQEARPVQKVIDLLTDLQAKVQLEGQTEAASYKEFSCFCQNTTDMKSQSIISGKDSINLLSTEIEVKTASRADKESDVQRRKAKQEELAAELQATISRCEQEAAQYQASAADLSKAKSSLQAAIQALVTSKPASFLAMRQSVDKALELADALNLVAAPKRKAVSALLQQRASVDPTDPTYKYHSEGIISTLNNLLTDFTAQKQTLDDEWTKTEQTCRDEKASLTQEMSANKDAMDALDSDILQLKQEIATARTNLVNADLVLKDDQLYVKDLTAQCESRAKDWDQRSQMRADELDALAGALTILHENVTRLDASVNRRVLLQGRHGHPAVASAARLLAGGHAAAAAPASFLQASSRRAAIRSVRQTAKGGASAQERQEKVASLLSDAGRRLGSTALAALAVRAAADPFTEVKVLIQRLIERLLKESTAEATKKGFCDEELGKARKDRNYTLEDVKQLNVELAALEVKEEELTTEIAELTQAISSLRSNLEQVTELRKQDKAANLKTISDAKEGAAAVAEALVILRTYYKQAAKATVLAQASPVDEDTSGPGFEGAYTGKQEASKGIIGMLEVIKTDFERTNRITKAAEVAAARAFVEFDRAARADISGKEMKKSLDEADLATTKATIAQKMDDLQTNMNLLDSALKVIEGLKPTCIDTGMSYAERVSKREEEIDALKRALCILDTESVEPDCQR